MVEAIIKVTLKLKFVKYQKYITRIYDLYEYDKPTKSIRRYIDNTVENALEKLDLNVISFNKRVYNQHKYTVIFTYKIIRVR